jgi:hypothetical protein
LYFEAVDSRLASQSMKRCFPASGFEEPGSAAGGAGGVGDVGGVGGEGQSLTGRLQSGFVSCAPAGAANAKRMALVAAMAVRKRVGWVVFMVVGVTSGMTWSRP